MTFWIIRGEESEGGGNMFVEKDPKIKLFGKTIELPEAAAVPAVPSLPVPTQSSVAAEEDGSHQDPSCSSDSLLEDRNLDLDAEEQESTKSLLDTKQDAAKDGGLGQPLISEEVRDPNWIPPITEDSTTPSADDGAVATKTSKTEEDQSGAGNSQDKTLKKPDKILPCPRCNRMDTKFCYFNNYHVNQPRHFCKNCHRYWTAGGTMRNVPVGAGRHKNKNTVSPFRHLTVREALQSAQVHITNVIHPAALNPNGSTVSTFNSDAPLYESMASALNIADESIINSTRNGFHIPEVNISVSHGSKVNRDDPSVGTFTSTTSSTGERGKSVLPESTSNFPPVPPQVPCFPGAPWPFPWHSDPWSSSISPATFSPSSFPVPFFSTTLPYCGCAVPSAWNVPCVFPPMPTTIQCDTPRSSTDPDSPTLGKHSRDDKLLKSPNGNEAETQKESSSEKSLWIPKTLRIDDPEEAAKSSIWETLGIKHSVGSPGGARLFKPFQSQSNSNKKSSVLESSSVLHANPAALSRALTFLESS